VINFECRGDAKQHQEAEVDHGVHESGSAVTQQRAHVHTGAVVSEATLHVLPSGFATVGRTTLPVAHAIGEAERTPHEHHGNDRVERGLQRTRNAFEYMPRDFRFTVPLGEVWNDSRHQGEHTHEEAYANGNLVWAKAFLLCRGGFWGCSVRAHGYKNASPDH